MEKNTQQYSVYVPINGACMPLYNGLLRKMLDYSSERSNGVRRKGSVCTLRTHVSLSNRSASQSSGRKSRALREVW